MELIDQLHSQFVEEGARARESQRKCQLLLPMIARHRVWEKKRFGSIYEYAAKLAGMSHSAVDNALWVLRKIEDKPFLQKVAAERGINRVKPVVTLATGENQEFWAEKAHSMSQHTLEVYAQETRKTLRAEKTQSDGVDVSVHLKLESARRLETLKKHADFASTFERALTWMENELASGAPAAVATRSRHIPAAVDRFVRERSGGLCAFPGCTRVGTSLHHTQRWGLEKVHDPERLHALCTAHERLAHLGLIEGEEEAPRKWRLRKQPDLSADKRFIDQFVALYRPT